MKTIITKKIDGYNIIVSFGDLLIEPVETRKKVDGLMKGQQVVKDCVNKGKELSNIWTTRNDYIRVAKAAFKSGDSKKHADAMYQIELRDEQIKALNKELVELKKKVEEKRQEIWKENLIYFDPKPSEIMIDEDKYLELGKVIMNAKEERGNLVDIDGKEIIDNRGVKYIKEGKIVEIKELGKKPEGPLLKDVTPEEFERIRYRYTSLEDIEAEKQTKLNSLISEAANMRSRFEIQGDSDALKKAQDWYKLESQKVDDLYKKILDNRTIDLEG